MSLSKALAWAAAAGAVAALAGCQTAPIPVAQNFETTSQYNVRAAGHWALVARDVARQTRAMLAAAGVAPNTPLHVVAPPNPSAFDLGFRDLLVTQLVHDGAVVRTDAASALAVSYGTQIVRPHDELILTTSIAHDGRYVARQTDVYYIGAATAPQYARSSHYSAVNMKVVSQ